jgi:hypothetical protein
MAQIAIGTDAMNSVVKRARTTNGMARTKRTRIGEMRRVQTSICWLMVWFCRCRLFPEAERRGKKSASMAEKMMDAVGDGKDIPLTKLTLMQSLANGGSIDVNELIRAKQTEKLLKDLNENKDLSIGKLMTYQALTSEDGFDINALIQAQFVEKLFADDEKTK